MMQLLKTWFKCLFAPRTKAQGLSSEPTYSQVERLIEAAGGASAKGGSLYSKPTYSQFERLIAAVAASSSSVTQLFAGRSLPQAPTQNEVAEVVKEIFKALGGTISTTSSNEDNP